LTLNRSPFCKGAHKKKRSIDTDDSMDEGSDEDSLEDELKAVRIILTNRLLRVDVAPHALSLL